MFPSDFWAANFTTGTTPIPQPQNRNRAKTHGGDQTSDWHQQGSKTHGTKHHGTHKSNSWEHSNGYNNGYHSSASQSHFNLSANQVAAERGPLSTPPKPTTKIHLPTTNPATDPLSWAERVRSASGMPIQAKTNEPRNKEPCNKEPCSKSCEPMSSEPVSSEPVNAEPMSYADRLRSSGAVSGAAAGNIKHAPSSMKHTILVNNKTVNSSTHSVNNVANGGANSSGGRTLVPTPQQKSGAANNNTLSTTEIRPQRTWAERVRKGSSHSRSQSGSHAGSQPGSRKNSGAAAGGVAATGGGLSATSTVSAAAKAVSILSSSKSSSCNSARNNSINSTNSTNSTHSAQASTHATRQLAANTATNSRKYSGSMTAIQSAANTATNSRKYSGSMAAIRFPSLPPQERATSPDVKKTVRCYTPAEVRIY
jgi:hypothetical protein